ncbi:MAG: GNAT family N-acetyltransferase [Actinobacteria bacterium]|nr:GNAT family N-acetyltransferase [Actinomycetota bacterium]
MSGAAGVRLARTSDVDDVAAVQIRAWRSAYGSLLPPEVLDTLDAADIALEWGRALLMPGAHRLLVATDDDGQVVGATSLGPSTDPDVRDVGEIELFVVDPDQRGQGHGSRLLNACVDLLAQSGYTEAVTWIPLDDEPRRAFLLSAGWGPDGAYRDLLVIGEQVVREVRLGTRIVDDLTPGADSPDS